MAKARRKAEKVMALETRPMPYDFGPDGPDIRCAGNGVSHRSMPRHAHVGASTPANQKEAMASPYWPLYHAAEKLEVRTLKSKNCWGQKFREDAHQFRRY